MAETRDPALNPPNRFIPFPTPVNGRGNDQRHDYHEVDDAEQNVVDETGQESRAQVGRGAHPAGGCRSEHRWGCIGCGGGGTGIPPVLSPGWSGPWSVIVPSGSVYALPNQTLTRKMAVALATAALDVDRSMWKRSSDAEPPPTPRIFRPMSGCAWWRRSLGVVLASVGGEPGLDRWLSSSRLRPDGRDGSAESPFSTSRERSLSVRSNWLSMTGC